MDSLAKRTKERRRELGLNQETLAEMSGLQQSDISKIENGRILKTTSIVALAKALRCDPQWLATGDGPMVPKDVWPFVLLTPEQVGRLTSKQLAMVEKLALDLLDVSQEVIQPPQTDVPKTKGKPLVWRDTVERKRSNSGTADKVAHHPSSKRAG